MWRCIRWMYRLGLTVMPLFRQAPCPTKQGSFTETLINSGSQSGLRPLHCSKLALLQWRYTGLWSCHRTINDLGARSHRVLRNMTRTSWKILVDNTVTVVINIVAFSCSGLETAVHTRALWSSAQRHVPMRIQAPSPTEHTSPIFGKSHR